MAPWSHANFTVFAVLVLTFGAGGCTGESSTGGAADAAMPGDASSGTDGSKGDAGMACDIPECLRPYNCRLSCGGPVLSSSCCPCAPPSFDDICCARDACPF
jgi:hypothetical protein